jgi:hypothetical protein
MAQTAREPKRSEYIFKAAAFLKNSLPELTEASLITAGAAGMFFRA